LSYILLIAQPAHTAAPPSGTADSYQVIMWVLGGATDNPDLFFQRLREANVTAIQVHPGESPQPALSRGFRFYVENIHRIAFLHERKPIYQADWDSYTSTRDKQHLIRKPCLHDPDYLADAKRDIQHDLRQYAPLKPLLYDLGDECSITSFASPMDYCFSDHTLAAFRAWLRDQYGTLDGLNNEWDTSFSRWDEVVPMTTYEIKDREQTNNENYSPWADHRTFMDTTFAESWQQFRKWVREIDPHTPVGLEGTQMPAAFGGYDLWRLSQVLDWVEPYDIGNSHDMFRSFMPPDSPIYATLFEHDPNHAGRRLWHLLLNGDRGLIIWCSKDWFDYESPDLTPKPFVAGMAELFADLRGPAARAIMHAERDRPPIAIHYSHPSVQVAWMLDSREDGDTWPRRFSSWEATHSRITLVRSSWTKLIQDLALQYDFVSTQQILDGALEQRGYQVLILPQSMAMGGEEAARIKAFVRAGGTAIADFLPGVFDEHGKRRTTGVLDGLFGVSRPSRGMIQQPERSQSVGFRLAGRRLPLGPAEPHLRLLTGRPAAYTDFLPLEQHAAGAPDSTPVLIARNLGKGSTHYLNLSPIDYAKWRLEGKGGDLRQLIAAILANAGGRPVIKVTRAVDGGPPIGCEVITYHSDGGRRYLAIMRNPEYRIDSLGEIGYTDNSRFEQPEQLVVEFDAPTCVRELLSSRNLGQTQRIELTLDPWKPLILELGPPVE
jgi:hypothetical protein